MRPFEEFYGAERIKYILCDIDDTVTTDGKLTAQAYHAMWQAHDAGICVIPVTGRPAGWCDLIIREWPVAAVVGENGAFVYYDRDGKPATYTHPSVRPDFHDRLAEMAKRVLAEVPGCAVARDQFSRIYDVAIDFNEDVHLPIEAAVRIKELCDECGATSKISSIHVNAWFGSYDKLSMTLLFFREILGVPDPRESVIFFGDSPNDCPMFAHFPMSCAVANAAPLLDKMDHLPAYITKERGGAGFASAVERILALR